MNEQYSNIDFLSGLLILSLFSMASGFVWGFIVGYFL